MSIGNWDPETNTTQKAFQLDASSLNRLIEISKNNQLEQLNTLLSPTEKQQQTDLMQLDKGQWFTVAESLSDLEIEHLMRFFTMAEKLPGCEAGAQSPVIWLGKVLKKRGAGISRDLVLWIKAHSDNQYLPHGALL